MVTDEQIIEACNTSHSMAHASSKVDLNYKTFAKRAKLLGVWNPNQSGKGMNKTSNGKGILLSDILNGKHPQYQSNKLRIRLIKEGIKEHMCECCGLREWNDRPIPLEVNHIDGVRTNHLLENLELICPNCHSQTETFRGKNIKK
jgi:hypothetical protein